MKFWSEMKIIYPVICNCSACVQIAPSGLNTRLWLWFHMCFYTSLAEMIFREDWTGFLFLSASDNKPDSTTNRNRNNLLHACVLSYCDR